MDAETQHGAPDGTQDLDPLLEEIPPRQRPECHDLQRLKAEIRNLVADNQQARRDLQRLRTTLRLMKDSNRRLEERLNHVVSNHYLAFFAYAALGLVCCLSFFFNVSADYSEGRTFIC
ncbi:uncharacterized protein ACO6RY_00183 [Pungitius sinensis]